MKRITLVAGSLNTCREIERQLAEYLGGEVEVEVRGLCMDVGLPPRLGAPAAREGADEEIVLLSSLLVREELSAAGILDPRARIIVGRRTVNCDHLDLVVALPPGTRALFVNDHPDTARDCVEALRSLGLDYVDYVEWYPGAPPPDPALAVAITPGEAALVPPGIGRVIDIGARILDFSTLAELLGALGLAERAMGQFSQRYLAKIVSVAGRLARSTEEARRLAEHLSGVIDSLRHGILVYDGSGRVSVCNENLRAMLNIRAEDPAGATLGGIVRNRSLLEFLEGRGDDSGLFRLADANLIVRRFEAGDGSHTVATFRDERDAAADGARLAREYRKRGYIAKYEMDDIIGESEAVRRAKRIAGRLAATDLTILVHGESGTGKELFASAIHAASGRRSGPFLAVDLGALSDDLIESELFGYEEGAFTGAKKGGKAGLFELADGGTIFLDEIGHVSPKVQARLLRVLQEKEVLRVGGAEIKRVDVRVIAASNEDLLERARRGEFREDLYFRLKTGLLRIPPLRERSSDLPLLIDYFLKAEGKAGTRVDPELLVAFGDYSWPGNVRELRNLITYMLAVHEGPALSLADLPDEGFFEAFARPGAEASPAPSALPRGADDPATRLPAAPAPRLSAEDRFILEAVASLEAEGKTPGREPVSLLADKRGLDLSPARVRARMERLTRLGYLDPSRGRRGTRLSVQGKALL